MTNSDWSARLVTAPTPELVCSVLVKSKHLLVTNGWTWGKMGASGHAHCAAGAVREAVFLITSDPAEGQATLFAAALKPLVEAMEEVSVKNFDSPWSLERRVVQYNDVTAFGATEAGLLHRNPQKAQKNVLAKFDQAIEGVCHAVKSGDHQDV